MKTKAQAPTDRKTRSQRAKLEEQGLPPSPPQILHTTKRAPRRAPRRPRKLQSTDSDLEDNIIPSSTEPTRTPTPALDEPGTNQSSREAAPNTPSIQAASEQAFNRSKGKEPSSSTMSCSPRSQTSQIFENLILNKAPHAAAVSPQRNVLRATAPPAVPLLLPLTSPHANVSGPATPPFIPAAVPQVFNLPVGNSTSYSAVNILVDAYPCGAPPYPPQTISFAIPKDMLPSVLSFVASHPLAEGTELKGLTIKHVIAAELIEPQNDLSAGIPPKGTVQKRVPDRFVDGKLFLGRTKEIAVEIEPPYADEETTASSNQELHGLSSATRSQVQQEPITETSRTRGWNFAGLLPTAQSVKNFIPFSTIRTISATGAAIPPVLPTREELDIYRPNPNPIAFTQGPDLQGNAGDGAQTEPHPGNYDMDMHDAPALEAAATGLAKRNHKERMQKLLLTKGQAEEKQQLKKMREELKAQTEKLAREKARLEKEKAEFEEKRAKAEAAQTERQVPGTKRKRLPSPDVGPPPPSVTYCLNYEDFSSDEEEDEGEEARAQRQTPTKRPRIDGPDEIKGDRHNAQPYTGERFALLKTPTISHGNNLFGKETSAEDADPPEFDRPKTGCSNTFKVPSPGDSGRENTELFLDEDDSIQNAHSAGAISSQSTFQTSPLASKQNQPRPAAGPSAAETSKSMAPPPRPSPSHASLPPTLPTFGRPAFVLDPVEKARQKALKHQPVTGSRLRESSRLSTSTIGSDAGDEPSPTSDEYDPKHPAIHAPTLSNTLPDALPWPGYVNAFEEWKKSVSPRVVGVVETSWNNVGDSKTAEYEFDQNMADFEAIESGGDVERSRGNSAVDVEGAAFDGEENGWGISPRVQEFIDARWMPEDEQVAENEFDMGMASWGAGLGVFA